MASPNPFPCFFRWAVKAVEYELAVQGFFFGCVGDNQLLVFNGEGDISVCHIMTDRIHNQVID